jgi:hypothetical protein
MSKNTRVNDEALSNLYDAVAKYIESRGGKCLVIGGVSAVTQQWDRAHIFHLSIKITGKKPPHALKAADK